MTPASGAVPSRTVARVSRFGDDTAMVLARERIRPPRGNEVVVRVTHASLGATDLLARSGGYLLQPVPGFVTGYDFVGELVTESAVSVALGLREGAIVAGVLPRMGSHATFLTVAPTLLVAVPPDLDAARAAVAPLDVVTAARALQLAGSAPRLLVQGAAGSVGSLAVQLARRSGRAVVGTASARGRDAATSLGVPVVDYTDPEWTARVRDAAGGAVDAVINHTGSDAVRDVLADGGVVVRTGFAGTGATVRRADELRAAALAARRRSERICSAPLFVATRRAEYRRILSSLLRDIAAGQLRAAEPVVVPVSDVWEAHRTAEALPPGQKVVLALG